MTGPIKALSWEFARRLVLTAPLIVSILLLGPLGIEWLFWVADLRMTISDIGALTWHSVYLALGFLLLATPLLEAYKGSHQRMFALPVSNSFIASWMMVSAILAVVGQELLIHSLYGFTLSDWSMLAIFGDNQSVIGPCQPVFATTISMLTAIYWSLKQFSFRKLFVCGVLVCSLIFWIGSHYYPHGLMAPAEAWVEFSILDASICATVIAVSWFVARKGIARERCGDNIEHSFEKRVEEITNWIKAIIFPDGVRDHASPEAAIAWNQWRHCGRDAALAAGFGFGVILAIMLFSVFGSRRGPEGVIVLMFILPGAVGFLTGSILGVLAPPSSRERITMFLATSPMSDARLARGLLSNAWRTTLISWLAVIVLGMLGLAAAVLHKGTGTLLREVEYFNQTTDWPLGILIVPVALLASGVLAWMLTSTFAVLHWTGSHFVPLFAIVGVLMVVMGLSLLSFFVDAETFAMFSKSAMMITATGIVVGSLLAFWISFQRKLVEPGSAALLLGFWVVESLLTWFIVPAPLVHRLFVIGVLMLSISPVAIAPLAISRNRHVA